MKILLQITICLIIGTGIANAQKGLTAKQKERAKVAQDIFSPDENDRMFFWYEEQMDKMKLSEDVRNEYYNTIYYHLYKIKRLDDRDSDKTENQIRVAYEKQLAAMHYDVSEFLNTAQYQIHVDSWKQLTVSIYRKYNWPLPKN